MPDSFSWKEPYLAALKETNEEKLTELVYAVEGVIFCRLQELAGSSGHQEERDEMSSALATLLKIQTGKLGWPRGIQDSTSPNG
jgi:hypothetical protein